jgi:formylglycine-generating enzyme required for sulfatase activity
LNLRRIPAYALLFLVGCSPSAEGDAVIDPDTDSAPAVAPDQGTEPLAACPMEMVALPGFCMDRYEAPGVAGGKPLAMQNATDAEAFCAARGKRLCTEAEWVRACQGAHARPYPYGAVYKRGVCNDDKVWRSPNWTVLGTWPSSAAKAEADRLYQADPSGSRPGCASEEGVFDLTGNVAEWVRRSFPNRTNYDHVMKGCYWAGCYGGSAPSCAFVNPAHPGAFRTYEAGFRCCKTR